MISDAKKRSWDRSNFKLKATLKRPFDQRRATHSRCIIFPDYCCRCIFWSNNAPTRRCNFAPPCDAGAVLLRIYAPRRCAGATFCSSCAMFGHTHTCTRTLYIYMCVCISICKTLCYIHRHQQKNWRQLFLKRMFTWPQKFEGSNLAKRKLAGHTASLKATVSQKERSLGP